MTASTEDQGFTSWENALAQNKLTTEQIATLQGMVDGDQADSLAAAAKMLDWQDSVITPPEHMYGF
jgi:hypothetical protein